VRTSTKLLAQADNAAHYRIAYYRFGAGQFSRNVSRSSEYDSEAKRTAWLYNARTDGGARNIFGTADASADRLMMPSDSGRAA
jgi:hypothetical protein